MTERDKKLEKYAALDQIDKALLEYKVRFPKINTTELGALVNLERRAVGKRLRSLRFKQALDEALLPAKELIEKRLDGLTRKYLGFCNSPNEVVAERATRQVLMTVGILKDKPGDGDGQQEPLVIEMPSIGKTLEIKQVKALPKDKT
jgi:hypothetical protein